MASPPLRPRWEHLLAPRALLAGVVIAFLLCCLCGRLVSHQLLFEKFERFHRRIAPESLFYPTACQVETLAEAQAGSDRILVVIGGSSVMAGVGQRAEHLWTNRLQDLLGERYRVINLGMPSCGAMEFGGVLTEMVAQHHPKVLFVTTATLNGWTGDAAFGVYSYFFWDAVYKGLLPGDAEHRAWAEKVMRAGAGDRALSELRHEMQVDRVAYCRDLWTTIAYRELCTVWNPMVKESFARARHCYADPDPGSDAPFAVRFPPARDADFMRSIQGELTAEEGLKLARPPLVAGIEEIVPPSSRPRTLVLLFTRSPYYVHRLSADDQQRYYGLYTRAQQALEHAHIAAVSIGMDWTMEDFHDFGHPSESGGARLAGTIAPRIREMARKLGYVKGEDAP